MSKQIILSAEEAKALVTILRSSWVPPAQQRLIYDLINRIDRELSVE